MSELTPQARKMITSLLGPSGDTLVSAIQSDEGMPERTVYPSRVNPRVLVIMAELGMDPERSLRLWRDVNAEAEKYAEERDAEERERRERNTKYQREYREREGDEYRKEHASRQRGYRAKH